jgi:hypothetical protein
MAAIFFMLLYCLAHYSILKKEAIFLSETYAGFQWLTRRYIPEHRTIYDYSCKTLKSYKKCIIFVTKCYRSRNREYGRRDPSRLPRGNLYPQRSVLTSPTSGGRSVGIVLSRTKSTELLLLLLLFTEYVSVSRWKTMRCKCEVVNAPDVLSKT